MKVLVVPDIHGNWAYALSFIKSNKDSVDYVVTLGDYVDDFDEKANGVPMQTGFLQLVELARQEPEKFRIILGNHDHSYISRQSCSGHHMQYAKMYEKMFTDNLDIMYPAVLIDEVLFSHAGVSSLWYDNVVISYKSKYGFIPKKFSTESLKKMMLKDLSLFDHCGYSSTGDSPGESCLWIRPKSLIQDRWPTDIKCQVVGHTELGLKKFKYNQHKLIVCDNKEHNCGFILDTNDLGEDFEQMEFKTHKFFSDDLYKELFACFI